MPILYRGSKLIPVPTAAINKIITKSGDGEHIDYKYNITLNGILLPYKGSPSANGAFHTGPGYPADDTFALDTELTNLVAKQVALSDLFSVEGGLCEIQPWDGGPNIKFNPRVVDIQYEQGQWVTETNYTITLEAPHIFYEGNLGSGYLALPTLARYNVESIQDNWNVELNEEEKFWTIKRDLSAKGTRVFDENGILISDPWHEARRWCIDQSTSGNLPDFAKFTDPMTSGLAGFIGYNYARIASTNKNDGTYSLSETWVATSGSRNYIESFEVSLNNSNEDGLDNVSINGEIRGLDITYQIPIEASGKIGAANIAFSGIWNFYTWNDLTYERAKSYSEIRDLNVVPKSYSISKQEKLGVVRYQRDYDNRPLNLITGSLVERFQISDEFPTKIMPEIIVPGRPAFLLQDIGANTPGTRNVSVTIIMDRKKEPYASAFAAINAGGSGYASLPRPNASGLINLFAPLGLEGIDWRLSENHENWQPQSLKLDKNITWRCHAM